MNTAEIKAIQNKMESDKQRLQEYLQGSRTAEEKVVLNTIKKIKKSEEKLIAAGIKLAEKINDDGTFTTISDNKDTIPVEATTTISEEEIENNTIEVVETATENTTSAIKKTKNSKKIVPTKKLREDDAPSKPKVVKFGATVRESVRLKLYAVAEDNNMKINETVVDLLGRVFDGENFLIDFDKKEQTKVTSFNLPEPMTKALKKMSKSTGMAKTELFNRLLEEALKEFFE